MDFPKSVPGVGLVGGKFVDENQATGQVGSLIPAAWGNAVTEELLAVIAAAGQQPSEASTVQLLAAIRVLSLKVGTISDQRPVLVSPTLGVAYENSALEIREAQAAGAAAVTDDYAPAISFHWGAKTAQRLWMDAAGTLTWGANKIITAAQVATEVAVGALRLGTQAEVNAGALDNVAVTPKKLRLGFAFSAGANGYIALPTWLGGFIFQWGRITITQSAVNAPASGNWNYTLAFPGSCFATWAFQHTLGGSSGGSLLERLCGGGEPGATGASFYIADADAVGSYTLRVFAIGN